MTEVSEQVLRNRYRASLSAKADLLQSLVAQISEDVSKGIRESEVSVFLHKFAGSAGMYGYDELARQARSLSNLIASGSSSRRIVLVADQLVEAMKDQAVK